MAAGQRRVLGTGRNTQHFQPKYAVRNTMLVLS
jgi:hypothetical protein